MNLRHFLTKLKDTCIPAVSENSEERTKTVTWLGHTKTYDFEGYLVSDTVHYRNNTAVSRTFYPGTKRFQLKKHILRKQQYKNDQQTDELWYDTNGKMMAYRSHHDPDTMLLLDHGIPARYTTHEYFVRAMSPWLDLIKKRTTIINYDLSEMSSELSTELRLMLDKAPSNPAVTPVKVDYTPIHPISYTPTPQPAKVEEVVTKETTASTPAPVKPEKPKLTPEMRKDRWEEQLLKRMEKHDLLMAQKAKIENAPRMSAEKRAERLASVNKRLLQNEKAQHILSSRLKALEMAKDRDTLKQFKVEERSEYKQWQAEIKKATQDIKSGTLSQEALAARKAELKEIRSFKKQALQDYRMATKSTKQTSIALRKLKSTKRQKAIFDLNEIVREKIALETALKTETDIFKYAQEQERLEQLSAAKRTILRNFKLDTKKNPPRVADMHRPVQPLLPAFEKALNK